MLGPENKIKNGDLLLFPRKLKNPDLVGQRTNKTQAITQVKDTTSRDFFLILQIRKIKIIQIGKIWRFETENAVLRYRFGPD